MNSFKQAYIQFKINWKESLFIGCIASLLVMLAQFIPVLGPIFISLGLLVLQLLTNFWIRHSSWPKDLDFLKKSAVSLLVVGVLLAPTSILIGSAYGVLQSPQDLMTSVPTSLGLFIIGILFYFILVHALIQTERRSVNIIKALDQAALSNLRNIKSLALPCLIFAVLFSVNQWTYSLGLIVIFPLLFYVVYFDAPKNGES